MTDLGTLDFSGSTTFALVEESITPVDLSVHFGAKTDFSLDLEQTFYSDPITLGVPYKLLVVDMFGNPSMEIENADLKPMSWSVNDKGNFSFVVPSADPKIAELQVPEREVQVWRGGKMIWWGVIVRARSDEATVEFQCQTLEWYFDRRVMGPVPKRGVFVNTNLERGHGAWKKARIPKSQPPYLPVKSLSSTMAINGVNSLVLSPSGGTTKRVRSADDWFTTANGATLSSTGNSQLTNIVNETLGDTPTINVNVFHDSLDDAGKTQKQITQARWEAIRDKIQDIKPDAKVDGAGKGDKNPVATNSTPAGRAQNRRVAISFRNTDAERGHGQYVYQTYQVTHPANSEHRLKATFRAWVYIEEFTAPAMNNWGLVLERQSTRILHPNPVYANKGYMQVEARKYVPISKQTPRNRWVRMEASLMVPNNGVTYNLEGRLFSPGIAYFDEADLFLDESLDFQNEEQARIVRALVDHAQDTEIGKSSFNIERKIRKTGVNRTRRYFFSDRTIVGDHLNEFTTLGEGMEWDIRTTPTRRILTSYYPRKERKTGYRLTLGQNIAGFNVDVDGLTTSNSVVIMANDVDENAREERSVTDETVLDGLILEIAYMATPGSSISSLKWQAQRGIERYRKPTTVPSLISNPAFTDEILRYVRTGDVLPVDVRSGWFQTVTEYRVLEMTLDPETEQITFQLMPEDTPITVMSPFGSNWRYFTQAQGSITGTSNKRPKESNKAYAARGFDDSGWSVGKAGFGWYDDGSTISQAQDRTPNTTIPVGHELWMRKTVKCTEEMYIHAQVDQYAYIYVNGNLLNDTYKQGTNFGGRMAAGAQRVPTEWLHPSGDQVIAVHVQDRLADRPELPAALYANIKVRGIYNPDHIGGE